MGVDLVLKGHLLRVPGRLLVSHNKSRSLLFLCQFVPVALRARGAFVSIPTVFVVAENSRRRLRFCRKIFPIHVVVFRSHTVNDVERMSSIEMSSQHRGFVA